MKSRFRQQRLPNFFYLLADIMDLRHQSNQSSAMWIIMLGGGEDSFRNCLYTANMRSVPSNIEENYFGFSRRDATGTLIKQASLIFEECSMGH